VSLLNAIDSAVGIQHQGITDKSGSDTVLRLTNGLIIGDFGRGRVDQPMLITKDTLVQLGDESKPAYQAVADCLDAGVPSVWVMRLGLFNVQLAGILSEDGIQLLTEDGQFLMPEGV
jgi:hypothetical protein